MVEGMRTTQIKGSFPNVEVWRIKADGSLDWVTIHWTKRGAIKASKRYHTEGIVQGTLA